MKHVDGDVYVCNQTCFIDWVFLNMNYSPLFTKIVVIKKAPGQKEEIGLKVLGPIETILSAFGIVFPEVHKTAPPGTFFSIKKLKEESGLLCYKGYRPVVIFPEGTKTNGLGILNIDEGLVEMIGNAAGLEENLRVHAIRFDHKFQYFSPYNTTDRLGLWSVIGIIQQFASTYIVQYYFNLEGPLHEECKTTQEKSDLIKHALMIRRKEQMMKHSDWRMHQEFLDFWNKT